MEIACIRSAAEYEYVVDAAKVLNKKKGSASIEWRTDAIDLAFEVSSLSQYRDWAGDSTLKSTEDDFTSHSYPFRPYLPILPSSSGGCRA